MNVNHGAEKIKKGGSPASDAEICYADWLKKMDVPLEARIAFELAASSSKKEKLDALLIGGCPDDVFESVLKIPKKSLEIYRELFFDESVFLTELDKLDYAENYYKGKRDPVDNLVLRGLNQGYQLLLLQFCNIKPSTTESLDILKRIFASAIYKATAVGYTGIGSGVDKKAIDLCKLSLQILDTIKELRSDGVDASNQIIQFTCKLSGDKNLPENFSPADIV